MMEYLKFDKNFRTVRRWRILSIDYRQLNELDIDPKRLNFNSVKFSNTPEDIHVIACWLDSLRFTCNFLIEHASFSRTSEGCEIERFDSEIVYFTLLIKLSWRF